MCFFGASGAAFNGILALGAHLKVNSRCAKIIILLVPVLPLAWIICSAFKGRADIIESPPSLFFTPTLENIQPTYLGQDLLVVLIRSLAIALIVSAGVIGLATPASYFFARSSSRWSTRLLGMVIASNIVPTVALSLPYYTMFTLVGLTNTPLALIACEVTSNLPFAIWFLTRFFSRLDQRLEWAAQVEGASPWQVFHLIVLPSSRPALKLAGLISFCASWNELTLSSILSNSANRTITPMLPAFVTQGVTQWGKFAFVCVCSMVPVMIAAALFMRDATKMPVGFINASKE